MSFGCIGVVMGYKIKFVLIICSALFFIACSAPIKVKVFNQENSNLNSRGDNVPITLVIYQLKDFKKFEQASRSDIITREGVVLGRDKIDSTRVQVPPNEQGMIATEIAKREGKYIGIVALFANPQGKNQKFIKKLNRVFKNTIELDITQKGITKADKSKGKNKGGQANE